METSDVDLGAGANLDASRVNDIEIPPKASQFPVELRCIAAIYVVQGIEALRIRRKIHRPIGADIEAVPGNDAVFPLLMDVHDRLALTAHILVKARMVFPQTLPALGQFIIRDDAGGTITDACTVKEGHPHEEAQEDSSLQMRMEFFVLHLCRSPFLKQPGEQAAMMRCNLSCTVYTFFSPFHKSRGARHPYDDPLSFWPAIWRAAGS